MNIFFVTKRKKPQNEFHYSMYRLEKPIDGFYYIMISFAQILNETSVFLCDFNGRMSGSDYFTLKGHYGAEYIVEKAGFKIQKSFKWKMLGRLDYFLMNLFVSLLLLPVWIQQGFSNTVSEFAPVHFGILIVYILANVFVFLQRRGMTL